MLPRSCQNVIKSWRKGQRSCNSWQRLPMTSKTQAEHMHNGIGGGLLTIAALGGIYYVYTKYSENREKVFIDAEQRKKVVILGSGWAAVNLLSNINTEAFDVIMVSPTNYFLYTPLLPSAVVGTLQSSTITQPARKFCKGLADTNIQFYEAACTNVDLEKKSVHCQDESGIVGSASNFDLDYDYLVVAVGSQPNTFNTKGVYENAFFVKTIEDARKLRNHIMDCIETANLPSTSPEERKQLLHFVIVGGGPTGVETAAEIHDFMEEDIFRYYPNLKDDIKVSLIQSGSHLLNTYSEAISIKTAAAFERQNINVIFNSRVVSVDEKTITILDKTKNEHISIPYGTCVWSTGVSLTPLTKHIISQIPDQNNRRAITTDGYLRVHGAKDVFALGDCGTIEQRKMLSKVTELFEEADTDSDGSLSIEELEEFAKSVASKYPQMKLVANGIVDLFYKYDTNNDNVLSLSEFKELLKEVDSKLTNLPATAQVATQEGVYLASLFNKHLHTTPILKEDVAEFKYNHMGSFAYIGKNDAALDLQQGAFSGIIAWLMWRSAYFTKQYSIENMTAMAFDWLRVFIFGRDISRS